MMVVKIKKPKIKNISDKKNLNFKIIKVVYKHFSLEKNSILKKNKTDVKSLKEDHTIKYNHNIIQSNNIEIPQKVKSIIFLLKKIIRPL